MTCPRCSGLLVPETVHDGALSEDLLRCVNCGRMGDAVARTMQTSETEKPTRCVRCKQAAANPGKVHCEPCRKAWRAYMNQRKLRLDVQARGFAAVLADVNERLLEIEARRNFLLANRKKLGA